MEFITNAEKVTRSITLPLPTVMEVETLADMVALTGEDLCLNKTKGALIIMLRSAVRNQLEALNLAAMDLTELENIEPDPEKRNITLIHKLIKAGKLTPVFVNSDEDIIKAWDINWIPELRVQKTAEEKALETLQGLSPEEMQAVLNKYAAQQKE